MTLTKKEQNLGAVISFFAVALILTYISFAILGFSSMAAMLSAIGAAFLGSAILCLLALRKYRKEGKPFIIDYLNIGTQRYILAVLMIMYGIDKLLGNFFDYQLFALDSRLNDISEFQLAWFFYGKNHWQELFTGIMEFVPGLFLFRRKTYYAAAIILLPVTAQVFLLNLFFKIGGITFPVSVILLACNIYILYSQREKIILFFKSLDFEIAGKLTGGTKTIVKIGKGIAFFLAAMVVFIKVKPVLFQSAQQKMYQRLVGVYTLKEMKRNGVAYQPTNDSSYYKDLYIEKQDRWNILRAFNGETNAFILRINAHNDSLGLYINKGGTGDGPVVIDTTTALKGIYRSDGQYLTINGMQQTDTLQLVYEKQTGIKPKSWFW
ncbi:hypothetical protein ACTHGU_00450 [Chitinophagaceae bacterium MMS25-I14]